VNPNIPHGRGTAEEIEKEAANNEESKLLSLEEIMNPFLDKGGAAFGAVIMAAALITLVALNAASQTSDEHPVYWVTLPAAFVMFCWDVTFGWTHRHETREIARRGRREVEQARAERAALRAMEEEEQRALASREADSMQTRSMDAQRKSTGGGNSASPGISFTNAEVDEIKQVAESGETRSPSALSEDTDEKKRRDVDLERRISHEVTLQQERGAATLVSKLEDLYRWSQETLPTVTAVVAHLPFALVPFALCMFVLVQALATKGWVAVFAYGWNHWVNRTGTVGAVGGMGFLSTIMCNFAGTNIGTTILLSRIIQAWQAIHQHNHTTISDRTWWGTIYSMALGVNFGAFSTAFSASLAGLLWRDILARKHIRVRGLDFARVNLPIIAVSMSVGCAVLIGEVYIIRKG